MPLVANGNGLYTFTVATDVSGGQWDTPANSDMEGHLQSIILSTFAYSHSGGANPLLNLGTNDGGVTIFVQFTADISSGDQTTLSALVRRAADYFIVTSDGGVTDLGEPSTISKANGVLSSTTITLQYKNGDGTNSNGYGETVNITPIGLLPITSTTSGVINGSGQYAFTVGASLQRGTVPIAIVIDNLPARNLTAVWT